MEKINFINNSQPAINDTNLNKLQDNVEDAIDDVESDMSTLGNDKLDKTSVKTTKTSSNTDTYSCNYLNKNIVTAFLASTTLSNATYSTIGNTEIVGDKLSVSNDSIVIGSGVSKIKVSANLTLQVQAAGGTDATIQILKNDVVYMRSYEVKNSLTEYYFYGCNVPDVIIPVQQGDTIKMVTNWTTNSTLHYDQYGRTYITVEVVE